MLTWVNQIDPAEHAMPIGAQASARFDKLPEQLELLLPTDPTDFVDRPPPLEEDPVIRPRHKGAIQTADEWISLIGEGYERSAHKSKWTDSLREEIEQAFSNFLKSVQAVDAKQVAVNVALDQPLHHEESYPCPTYCPVYRFGPNARGPPTNLRALLSHKINR